MKKILVFIFLLSWIIVISCKKNDPVSPSLTERLLGDNTINWIFRSADSSNISFFKDHCNFYFLLDPFPTDTYFLNFNTDNHVFLIKKVNYITTDTIYQGIYSISGDKVIFEKTFIQNTSDSINRDSDNIYLDSIAQVIITSCDALGIVNKISNENKYSLISIKKKM